MGTSAFADALNEASRDAAFWKECARKAQAELLAAGKQNEKLQEDLISARAERDEHKAFRETNAELRAELDAEQRRTQEHIDDKHRILREYDVALTAERAVHERTKAELREAREKIARLRIAYDGSVKAHHEEATKLQAALGRAVAALRWWVDNALPDDAGVVSQVRAIIADPTSAQAGERARVLDEFAQASVAQSKFSCPHYEPPCDCGARSSALDERVNAAFIAVVRIMDPEYADMLAAVDARRGNGGE